MEIQDIRFVTSASHMDQMPTDGWPEVAFVGRSNVGKSSLLNMLAERKALARISRTPGKTRTFNFYGVNQACFFVDIPGYGYAKISRTTRNAWTRQINTYLRERGALRLVLHLIDGRHPPGKLDQGVMQLLGEFSIMRIVVLTKTDKLSGNVLVQRIGDLGRLLGGMGIAVPVVASSARTKRGRAEILGWIRQAVVSV